MNKRSAKPEFYKALMNPEFYSSANKSIKFQESENFWIFKAGAQVFKVKKPTESKSSIDLDQVFCFETLKAQETRSPALETKLCYLVKDGENYSLAEQPGGEKSYYVLSQLQLPDRVFFSYFLAKEKLKSTHVKQVGTFLAELHGQAKENNARDIGGIEDLKAQVDDLIYQSKKHLGVTLTQPILDMMLRPVVKYLDSHKKNFGQRGRKGFVKEVHGGFSPRKIALQQSQVLCLFRSDDPLKDRYKDVASDLADLSLELIFAGQKELAQELVEAYISQSQDEQMSLILPLYQVIQALRQGLNFSLLRLEEDEEENKTMAIRYYELMVELARTL